MRKRVGAAGSILAVFVALAALLPSCSPKIVERVVTVTRDTTIVEVHERVIHDTARVEIPIIKEVNVTPADSSHLENEFAVSDAWVEDGLLHHNLRTKPQTIAVPISVQVADTTTTHEHYEKTDATAIKVVEVDKPLSWWQKFRIGAFWWLLGGLALALCWIFRKPLLALLKI